MDRTNILTPVGRLIAGNLYKPNTTDAEGKPLVVKSGANAGQPREDYYFMLAIPKGQEKGWWETPWGQLIYQTGAKAFPQACQSPTFAWKVKDGDSAIPNRRGKKPCDMEGARGHWLLSFSSGYPPKTVRNNGTEQIMEKDAVKIGYWVQVFGSIGDNGSQQQPGVFLNHSAVNLVGYDKEITTGPDLASVGFGQNIALPPGVSATPLAGTFNPAVMPAPGAVPGMPAMPGAVPAAMPVMPGAAPAAVAMPAVPVAVQPNPGFLAPMGGPQAGAVPAVPGVVPAAPVAAAPARQLTAKAGGATYEQLIGNGWTDATLVQHGMMVA